MVKNNVAQPVKPLTRVHLLVLQMLCGLALAVFFYSSYGFANYYASTQAFVPSVVFDWEKSIPFLEWTIVPYWSINLLYALSLFLTSSKHQLLRHVQRLFAASFIACAFFLLYPLHFSFAQPVVTSVYAPLFNALRSFDQPFNQAPSLHVALAAILCDFYCFKINSWFAGFEAKAKKFIFILKLLCVLWFGLIVVSVLSTYQHHFIDIPTGFLLGVLCVWAWPYSQLPAVTQLIKYGSVASNKLALYYLAASVASGAALFVLGIGFWYLLWPASAFLLVAANYAWLGAQGFGKQFNGYINPWVSALYAPYTACAWLNSRLWTRHEPKYVAVLPQLLVGRMPSPCDAKKYNAKNSLNCGSPVGITWHFLLDMTAEFAAPQVLIAKQRSAAVPVLDLTVPTVEQLVTALNILDAQLKQGKTVLVCCALGYSRSVAVVLCWLVIAGYANNIEAAVAHLQQLKPRFVIKPQTQMHIQQAVAQFLAQSLR